ncbi:unnamed protein product, partial [Mesorhabditis spiculigera]
MASNCSVDVWMGAPTPGSESPISIDGLPWSPKTGSTLHDSFGDNQTLFDDIFNQSFPQEAPVSPQRFAMELPGSPASPIDVITDCPDLQQPVEQKPFATLPPRRTTSRQAPLAGTSRQRMKKGRPTKAVASNSKAQLAKNWRMRKEEEERQKSQTIQDQASLIAELKREIDQLRYHQNQPRVSPSQESVLKIEEENNALRRKNQALVVQLDNLYHQFMELTSQLESSGMQ